jgi:hypothetical protein
LAAAVVVVTALPKQQVEAPAVEPVLIIYQKTEHLELPIKDLLEEPTLELAKQQDELPVAVVVPVQ